MTDKLRTAAQRVMKVIISSPNVSDEMFESWMDLRAALAEDAMQRLTEDKLLATFQNLRDESHTIQGASDDYKQGREMGIQICINELLRGEK